MAIIIITLAPYLLNVKNPRTRWFCNKSISFESLIEFAPDYIQRMHHIKHKQDNQSRTSVQLKKYILQYT
jgi:hypothetical protein